MIHGAFGCQNEWSYMLSVTNGDGGDSIRNVLDITTSDNLAFGGRLNWAFLNPSGYQEGATRQNTCSWYGELGVWAFYYADRFDGPHTAVWDRLLIGGREDLEIGVRVVLLDRLLDVLEANHALSWSLGTGGKPVK